MAEIAINNVANIKFAEIELPACPFVWSYNEYLFPITETKILDASSFKMPKEFADVFKNYTTDYFSVKQKLFKENNRVYISFHSWYFSKISKLDDMTRSQFKMKIYSGLFADNTNNIYLQTDKNGIPINCIEERTIHVHNKRLSPGNSNTVTFDLGRLPDTKNIEFVTITFNNKIKKCCVTRHYLEVE